MNNSIIIPIILLLAISAYIIALQLAYRKARTELATLRNKPTLVPNPALNVNSSGEIARLRTVSQNYRAALADIHASTSKSKNGTAVMVTRKAAKALGLPEQAA